MAIYMKWDGIDGDVKTKGFEKWIEVSSFHVGASRSVHAGSHGGKNRETSEPVLSEVTVTKVMDSATTKLFLDAVAGDLSNKVKFKFTTTTKDKVDTYAEFELEKVGVSGFSLGASTDSHPVETLSLNYTKIVWSITPRDEKVAGAASKGGYNTETGSKL